MSCLEKLTSSAPASDPPALPAWHPPEDAVVSFAPAVPLKPLLHPRRLKYNIYERTMRADAALFGGRPAVAAVSSFSLCCTPAVILKEERQFSRRGCSGCSSGRAGTVDRELRPHPQVSGGCQAGPRRSNKNVDISGHVHPIRALLFSSWPTRVATAVGEDRARFVC